MKSKLTKLFTLLTILTLGITNVWADEIFGFTVTSSTTAKGSYSATGGTAVCSGAAMSTGGSNEITVGTQTFYKFSSSSVWTFTLSSGKFAAGDVISFTGACTTSNKTGKGFAIQTSPVIAVTGDFPASQSNVVSYTVVADDGIAGQSSFSIKRNDSDIKFGTVSVTRSSGGGEDPVCPSGLSITSKNDKTAFLEGDAIELTAALTAGNGTITYQWYKGSVAAGNEISGATNAKYEVNSCTTADDGDYFCVASKTSCSDAVNASAFTISVAADTKCFNMPAITSKPANLASVAVTGGTLSDVSTAKSVAMNAAGLKLDGNNVYLKVTLTGASIVTGTKITVAWKNAGSGAGIALVNENLEEKVIDETSVSTEGSASHTFTAAEAANYADEFIIHRNASGTGIYVNAITVEDCGPAIVKHTVTLEYADGATADGSLLVADGKTAAQPAEPTWEHHRFDGWYNGASPYDWASTVSGDITLTAHWTQLYTITYAAGDGTATGDAPTQVDKAEGETFEVAANTFAVAGKDFDKWNDGANDYAPGDTYTMDAANVVLTAIWKAAADKYTVIFKDGETTLDTKLVEVGSNPSDAGVDKTKALSTFAAWQKDDADIALDDAFWATVAKDATVTLNARWTKAYATDVDFETEAVGHAGDEDYAKSIVDAHNYALSTKTGTTFDENTSTNNGAYLGLKIKNSGTTLSWNVVAGKVVELKAGVMVANGSLSINGGAATTIDGGSTSSGDNFLTHYFYSATEALYVFTTSNGSAEVIKAITMRDPYTVSFDVNGGDDPIADMTAMPSITLPTPTKGSESFLGWFDALDNFIGNAGDTYAPEATIELVAHWESISTDARLSEITFSAAGTLSPAFDPEVVNYTYTMPYGTAAVPTITGATAVNANAKEPVIVQQASAWNETAIIRGVAQSDDTKAYNITMKLAPKDGVCLVWADATGNNTMTVDAGKSLLTATAGAASTKNTSEYGGKTGYKLNSRPANMHITLDGTETFQAGDVVEVFVTTVTDDYMRVFDANDVADEHKLAEGDVKMVQGANRLVLPATSTASLYLVRGAEGYAYDMWNPFVAYIAVYRPMNPMLTAMTIDGRTVTINEAAKTATVTIPYEADLAALTIVDEVVWNAPAASGAKVVTSNSGNWVIGDNTYVLTDKDGDATTYTITVARDVLKHTVSFNTHGGSAVASEEVEHNGYLAAAPADPTKDEYIFQGWAEVEDGAIVDVTSFAITADKEFHAVWVAEPAGIKLINGDGSINTVNFTTGVTASTVNFDDADHNCAVWGGTQGSISGTNALGKIVQYNATTNQTKVKVKLYSTNSGAKEVYLHKILEGETTAVVETIAVASKTPVETEYYAFNNDANRSIYITTNSADVKILQVKVIDDGATLLKRAGQAGYEVNLNKGRVVAYSGTEIEFEGLTFTTSSNYGVISSTEMQIKAPLAFAISTPVTMTVTTNAAKYYVSQNSAEDGTTATAITAAGTETFDLTATGTWYIVPSTTSAVKLTNIAFSAPRPDRTITFDSDGGSAVADIVVKDGEVAVAPADPTKDDNDFAGWYLGADPYDWSAAVTADIELTAHWTAHVNNDATLSALSYGGNAITLSDGVYEYDVNLPALTLAVPALTAVPNAALATADVTDAADFDGAGQATSTVLVTAEDNTTQLTYTVNFTKAALLPQVDVTENTTWDWANIASENITLTDLKNHECVLANVEGVTNDATFNSQALLFYGERVRNVENTRTFATIGHISFNVTVAGTVRVEFSDNGTNNRRIKINEEQSDASSSKTDVKTFEADVTAGIVTIMGISEDGASTNQYVRISRIEFEVAAPTKDLVRDGLSNGKWGTLCPKQTVENVEGATFYQIAYLEEQAGLPYNMVWDAISGTTLEAGKPYFFIANATEIRGNKTGAELDAAGAAVNGFYGWISPTDEKKPLSWRVDYDPTGDNTFVIYNNEVLRLNADGTELRSERCYININATEPTRTGVAPMPGRDRIRMSIAGVSVVTGMEEITNDQSQMTNKVIIDGRLYILRGEKMYDATGRQVK